MDRSVAVGSPLRNPAFQRLWVGLSLSYLGDQFTTITLLWFVLQLTGSGAAVGLVILCFQLPGVITGAFLGRLLDRFQPRLVMGLLVLTLPTIAPAPRAAQPKGGNRWLGFGTLFSLRYVPALTLLALVFFFSYGPLEAALPVYSSRTLHTNADGYGLLWTGFGIGAFLGVIMLTRLSTRWRPSIALPLIAISGGACILAGLGGLASPSLRRLQQSDV